MDILKAGLKEHSLNELKDIHLQQMTDIENLLTKICKRDNGLSTDRNIKKWLKQMNNRDEEKFYGILRGGVQWPKFGPLTC